MIIYHRPLFLAEREGFEPSVELVTLHSLSRRAPSADSAISPVVLTRIFHEWPAATTDMAVLSGVLECRTLRRTLQVRLGSNTLRLPDCTPILMVSQQQFVKHPG